MDSVKRFAMKAFLLTAGYGKRLYSLTENCPKPLVLAGDIPLICYALALLKEVGVTSIICNLHYLSEQITDFFSRNNNFGFQVSYSHEKELLGTGGGLKACEDFFECEKFFMINSDIITDLSLNRLENVFANNGSCIALHPAVGAAATVSIQEDRVADFKNALSTQVVPRHDYMGVALLSPEIFTFLETDFSSVVYTGFTSLIQKSSLNYYEHNGIWIDAGTVESIKEADARLAEAFKHIKDKVKSILGRII